VVRHLGRLITEQEEQARRAQAEQAARQASFALDEARADLARRQGQIVAKEVALRRAARPADAALLRVEIADLKKTIEPVEQRLRELTKQKTAFDLRAAMEAKQLGLQFELVDPGQVPRAGISRPRELTIIGVIVFL